MLCEYFFYFESKAILDYYKILVIVYKREREVGIY